MRTARGRQEIDLIVERLGDRRLDRVVVTSGRNAYRRTDQVAVAPLALLGP
jgi:uncharacterized protein